MGFTIKADTEVDFEMPTGRSCVADAETADTTDTTDTTNEATADEATDTAAESFVGDTSTLLPAKLDYTSQMMPIRNQGNLFGTCGPFLPNPKFHLTKPSPPPNTPKLQH